MIKLIVLDFGGVYFTYDYFKLMGEFSKELGISVEDAKKAWDAKLDEFTKGECDEQEFWKGFLDAINKEHDAKKMHEIVIRQFKPIPEMLKLVDKLKKKYKVGMLTNQTTWLDEINSKYDFFPIFDVLVISKNEGTQKPEDKIFKILIQKAGCKPEEIVFIDDTPDYRSAAEKAGMHFIHFRNTNQLKQDLKKLEVEI